MEWASHHASEIAVAIITVLLTRLIDYRLAKRSKLFYFFTNAAQFQVVGAVGQPPTLVHTITLAVWNTGRAVAEKVRIVHYYLPKLYQVWPPVGVTTNTLASGHVELELPKILPNQIAYVSYMDFNPLTAQTIVLVEAEDHQAKLMPFQFARLFPKWMIFSLQVLVVLGIVVVARYAYIGGTALLRLIR
jgi:hypothetical protein